MDFSDNFQGDRLIEQFSSAASETSHGSASREKDEDISDPKPIEKLVT